MLLEPGQLMTQSELGENLAREWAEEPRAQELNKALHLIKSEPQAGLDALTELAESGSSLSMMYLATKYLVGRPGIEKNLDLGRYWLQRSATAGSIEGAFRLAWHLLENGRPEDGMREFQRLASLKYSPALFALGWQYYKGKVLKPDLERAIFYFELAEQSGHLQAANQLSHIMMRPEMGPQSWLRGIRKKAGLFKSILVTAHREPNSDRLRGG